MPETKIVCSIQDLKKNERRGTMKECAKSKQIRYYGLKKVDQLIINKLKTKTKGKKRSLPELIGKLTGLKTKYTKLIKKIHEKQENGESVKVLKTDAEKIKKEYEKLAPTVKKMMEEENKDKKTVSKSKTTKK
jgi:hypothetical protein